MYSGHEAESADTTAERKAFRVERLLAAVAVVCAVVILLAAFPPWRRHWDPLPGGGWNKYEVDSRDSPDSGDDPTEEIFRVTLGLAAIGAALLWLAPPPSSGRRRWAAFGVFAAASEYTALRALAPSLGLGSWTAQGLGSVRPRFPLPISQSMTELQELTPAGFYGMEEVSPTASIGMEELMPAAGLAMWAAFVGLPFVSARCGGRLDGAGSAA